MKKQSNIIKDISKIVVFFKDVYGFLLGPLICQAHPKMLAFHRNFIGVGRSLLTKCISDEENGLLINMGK